MPNRVFGDIPGYPEGTYFGSRLEASHAGIHRPTQGGISGSANQGADSIVVSGGYEDDRDKGTEIMYIGHGGRDPETGEQVADQELTAGNLALIYSCKHDLPVRVLRGANPHSMFAPKQGYRYDGLYRVEEYGQQKGKSGHKVWCFRLIKIDADTAPWKATPPAHLAGAPKKALTPTKRTQSTLSKAPLKIPSTAIRKSQPPLPLAAPSFKVGDKVTHATFGEGVVSEITPSPYGQQDQYVTVDFPSAGRKKLLVSKANLERIP